MRGMSAWLNGLEFFEATLRHRRGCPINKLGNINRLWSGFRQVPNAGTGEGLIHCFINNKAAVPGVEAAVAAIIIRGAAGIEAAAAIPLPIWKKCFVADRNACGA